MSVDGDFYHWSSAGSRNALPVRAYNVIVALHHFAFADATHKVCRDPLAADPSGPQRKEQQMPANYPKMLPWLAKKANVPLKRAEVLWNQALRHAIQRSTQIESPQTWKLAVDRLLDLLGSESPASRGVFAGWVATARLPALWWIHGLATQQSMMTIAANWVRDGWQRRAY